MFQRLLDVTPSASPYFRKNLIVAMQRLAAKSGLFPSRYELFGITSSDKSQHSGGFADIYKGSFRGVPVCLKVFRIYSTTQSEHFLKLVSKEAILWGQLHHPNLLGFYSIFYFNNQLSLVAPWMEYGNVCDFLKSYPDSNRILLLFDVSKGLYFLHQNNIVHEDLKGANILVNDMGRACLGDFGLSSVSDTNILAWTSHSSASSKGGTVRWQAPELFDLEGDEDIRNTQSSDMYAWGCVAYEIFVGEVPFAHITRDAAVIIRVTSGERPAKPAPSSASWTSWGLTKDIWSLIEPCWNALPKLRPTSMAVLAHMEAHLPQGSKKNADERSLTAGQFREITRHGMADIDMSVEGLEALLSQN